MNRTVEHSQNDTSAVRRTRFEVFPDASSISQPKGEGIGSQEAGDVSAHGHDKQAHKDHPPPPGISGFEMTNISTEPPTAAPAPFPSRDTMSQCSSILGGANGTGTLCLELPQSTDQESSSHELPTPSGYGLKTTDASRCHQASDDDGGLLAHLAVPTYSLAAYETYPPTLPSGLHLTYRPPIFPLGDVADAHESTRRLAAAGSVTQTRDRRFRALPPPPYIDSS